MGSVTIAFTLDSEHDADLLAWLDKHGKRQRSAAIREALRRGVGGADITLADVYQEMRAIRRQLRAGAVVQAPAEDRQEETAEEAEIRAKLTQLGS